MPFSKRRFSLVMLRRMWILKRRDDLPEMRLPLVILLSALYIITEYTAVRLSHAPDYSEIIGAIVSLPILTVSVCAYSLIILLWRRAAALLLTPVTYVFLRLMCGGADFAVFTITLSTLFISYVSAVSLISRETKFRRILSVSLSTAICIVLTLIAYAGLRDGSIADFAIRCTDSLDSVLGGIYSNSHALARRIIVMTPAYLTAVSILMASFLEAMQKSAFRILECTDLFIGITHRITLPPSYAAVYMAALLLRYTTSSETNPLASALLQSAVIAMMLPCAAVGTSVILRKIRIRMYYASRKRLITAVILAFAVISVGLMQSCIILSIAGGFFTLAGYMRRQMKKALS